MFLLPRVQIEKRITHSLLLGLILRDDKEKFAQRDRESETEERRTNN